MNIKKCSRISILVSPFITYGGVKLMCEGGGGGGGYINLDLRPLGVPITIGGIVLDSIKAPICLTISSATAVIGGLTKLASLIFDKPASQQAIDQIFKSFLLRLCETATLLVALELEDQHALEEKLKSGDIEELVGLTLLHTAYVSRHELPNSLLLASEKRLDKADCPQEGLKLFKALCELKESITKALKLSDKYDPHLRGEATDKADSKVVCDWIKLIKSGKEVTAYERPDATPAQLASVNDIISKVKDLKTMGMNTLPKSPEEVVRRMPKR